MFGKRKTNIKEKYSKDGWLDEVSNPAGSKEEVFISQRMGQAGFSAHYSKSNRSLNVSSNDAEALARKLAKKGHKKVTFRD